MKQIICILSLVVCVHFVFAQGVYIPPYQPQESDVDLSPDRILGFTFLGLGVATIGYTAARSGEIKNPEWYYVGGGISVVAGSLFLIFGDKEPPVKYWKGLEGNFIIPNVEKKYQFAMQPFDYSKPIESKTIITNMVIHH